MTANSTVPKLTFTYSPHTEAIKILWTAHQIVNRFYEKKDWLVLPYLVRSHTRIVYFPHLDYSSTKGFWKIVTKHPSKLIKKKSTIIKKLEPLFASDQLDYKIMMKKWEGVHSQFFKIAREIMPELFVTVKKLEVWPTKYGVISTSISKFFQNKRNDTIIVHVRADADISHIAEAILIDRLNSEKLFGVFTWEEKEAVMDFLLTRTKLARLFPNYRGTLVTIHQKQNGKLSHDSQSYLIKLGLTKQSIFAFNRERSVTLLSKVLILTDNERSVLGLLMRNSQNLVSFDDIAHAMWGDKSEEKYSLFAITKIIQRIREKIRKHGVSSEVIQTIRGKGFILLD